MPYYDVEIKYAASSVFRIFANDLDDAQRIAEEEAEKEKGNHPPTTIDVIEVSEVE